MGSLKIEECDIGKEGAAFRKSRNVEYAQVIERILKEGLGRFDCLKISFDVRKNAIGCAGNFNYLKKTTHSQIGRFLSKNNVLIFQRDANVYFHALGGVKVKPEECL